MKKIMSVVLAVCITVLCAVPAFADSAKKTELLTLAGDEFNPVLVGPGGEEYSLGGKITEGGKIRAAAVLPSAYDSRDNGLVTPVKDQRSSGACWAFATIGALESTAVSKGLVSKADADFSEAHIIDFAYAADMNPGSPVYGEGYTTAYPYMMGGNWVRASATLSLWNGPEKESSYPFDNTVEDYTLMPAAVEAYRYNHDSGVIFTDADVLEKTADIKNRIMSNGSVTVSFNYDPEYYNEANHAYYTVVSGSNHMVTLVGWDDSYSAQNFNSAPSANGAWLVKDSWGTQHHDNGFFWISYKDSSLNYCVAYNVAGDDTYDNNYTYSAVGYTAASAQMSGSKVANVFTAKSDEILGAVAFYTLDSGVSADIRIYSFSGNGFDPENCECLAQTNKTIPNKGYHTVEIPGGVSLSAGEKFAVEIAYSLSSQEKVKIPVEFENGTDNGQYVCTSSAGQSYVCFSENDYAWYDVTEVGCGNVPVQAFTSCDHSYALGEYKGSGSFELVCGKCGGTSSLDNVSVRLSKTSASLKPGETVRISAAADDLVKSLIVYESSDVSVAKVDTAGKVAAVSEGKAVITVSLGDTDIYAVFTVTVQNPSEPVAKCTCLCHKTGFAGFIYKIVRIFWKLFDPGKRVCECGEKHW